MDPLSMRDLHYELDLLRRMEQARVNELPLTELELYDGGVLWQRFHQAVFDGDIKRFARTRSFSHLLKEEKRFKQPLRGAVVVLTATLLSAVAFFISVLRRPRVLVFSIDKVSDQETKSDFRIRGIYRTLSKNTISYVECFHTLLGRSVMTNALRRKRPALYLEGFDWVYYLIRPLFETSGVLTIENLSGTDDEVAFMRHIITKYVRTRGVLVFRKKILTVFMKLTGVKAVVGIDDVRHYHEVVSAARTLDIPSIMVQHGHFTKYHTGWLGYQNPPTHVRYITADLLLAWSDYWKEELVRLGSVFHRDQLKISGYQSASVENPFSSTSHEVGRVILIPHETESPKAEVSEYIRRCARLENTIVYLKIRPDLTEAEQFATYDEDVRTLVRVATTLSDVPRPHMVCGVYSTFLYDMVLACVPVLVMETSMDYGEGMIKNGVAETLSLNSLEEGIHRAENIHEDERRRRRERIASSKNFEETLLDELTVRGVL